MSGPLVGDAKNLATVAEQHTQHGLFLNELVVVVAQVVTNQLQRVSVNILQAWAMRRRGTCLGVLLRR